MRFGTLVIGSTLAALFAAPALAGVNFTFSFGNGWCAPAATCAPVQTVCAPVQPVFVPVQPVCAPVRPVYAPAPVVCAPVAPACGVVAAPVFVQPVYGGGWRGGHGHRHDHGRDFTRGPRRGWR